MLFSVRITSIFFLNTVLIAQLYNNNTDAIYQHNIMCYYHSFSDNDILQIS